MEFEEVHWALLRRARLPIPPSYMPLTPLDGPFSDLAFAIGAAELGVEGDWARIFDLNLSRILKFLQEVPISSPGLVGGVAGLNCMVSAAADLFDESLMDLMPIMYEKVISDSEKKIDSVRKGENLRIADYDYVEGLVGIGYHLDILKDTLDSMLEVDRKQTEREIVDSLTSHILKFKSEAFYIHGENIPEHYVRVDLKPCSLLDFGFAHGILGVYWYLSRKLHIDPRVNEALTVLELQMAEIFQRGPNREFSPFLLRQGNDFNFAPVGVNGWCYGHPGMALADSSRGRLRARMFPRTGEPFSFDLDSGLGICHGLSGQLLVWDSLRLPLPEQPRKFHRGKVESVVSDLDSLFDFMSPALNENFGFWNGVLGGLLATLQLERSLETRSIISPLKLFGLGVYA
ncbi:lanthionine synthetase LanC family protein [Corynebacterium minutissimum]